MTICPRLFKTIDPDHRLRSDSLKHSQGEHKQALIVIQCTPLTSRKELTLSNTDLISNETIERAIYLIRGEKVMLDRDLARLYDVSTAAFNQAVRRNRERFPEDFMFQLTSAEVDRLNRSQFVIGSVEPPRLASTET